MIHVLRASALGNVGHRVGCWARVDDQIRGCHSVNGLRDPRLSHNMRGESRLDELFVLY